MCLVVKWRQNYNQCAVKDKYILQCKSTIQYIYLVNLLEMVYRGRGLSVEYRGPSIKEKKEKNNVC